jgi:MFS family permease
MRHDRHMSTPHDPYAALRHSNYRLFALGSSAASVGAQMQTVAVGWELYERTNQAIALGYVGLAQILPVLILTLPAGHVADRFDRKRIAMAAQTLTAGCSAGLALLSWTRGPVLFFYLLLALIGVARAFHQPARASLIPHLVPDRHFGNAVTWNSTIFQIASMAGPALGGALIALSKAAWPVYAADALLTLGQVTALSLIPVRTGRGQGEPVTLDSLAAGLRHVWREKVVLSAITLDMFGVLLGGATALLPIYAKDILNVGPEGLGWLRAAPSAGALMMALTLAHRPPLRRAGPALLLAVTGFGLATIGFGLSTSFPLSLLMLAVLGAMDNISVVVRQSLVQMWTPDELRGRVSAVNSLFIGASNELGAFESGVVAAWFGAVVSVVAGGVGTILVVAAVAWAWPEIRRLGPLVPEPAVD